MLQDWYYQSGDETTAGGGEWTPLPPDIVRVQLTASWALCVGGTGSGSGAGSGGCTGVILTLDASGNPQPGNAVCLRDPTGIIAGSLLAAGKPLTIPNGTCLWAIGTFDGPAATVGTEWYEPLNFGECCCIGGSCSGGSSGGSGSGGSGGSGSGGSGHSDGTSGASGGPPTSGGGSGCGTPGWVQFQDCNGNWHCYWGT